MLHAQPVVVDSSSMALADPDWGSLSSYLQAAPPGLMISDTSLVSPVPRFFFFKWRDGSIMEGFLLEAQVEEKNGIKAVTRNSSRSGLSSGFIPSLSEGVGCIT